MVIIMNHHITYANKYLTLPLLQQPNGLYTVMLEKNLSVIEDAIRTYSKVFAFRCDFHLPNGYPFNDTNLITRFFASFKAIIRADYNAKKRKSLSTVHFTEPKYIWTREVSSDGKPHYHVCILLNGNAYRSIGKFENERQNLYCRVIQAWESALNTNILNFDFCFNPTLVHIPNNAEYFIQRNELGFDMKFRSLFKRLSYFAKVATKTKGDGIRNYGSSRISRVQFSAGYNPCLTLLEDKKKSVNLKTPGFENLYQFAPEL
jgi:hypothetical protein